MAKKFRGFLMSIRLRLPAFLCALLAALGAIALWLGFQTPWLDIAKFLLYEVFGIILPGVLLYGLIWADEHSWLKLLVVGWATGYALEVALFDVAGALNIRPAFHFYPLVSLPLLLVWLWRRRSARAEAPSATSAMTARQAAGLAVFLLAALSLMAFVYFLETPLPGTVPSVNYYSDLTFHISSAAEAKNHFPIADPRVLGEPIYYYWFVNSHLGAASFVTGIEIGTLVFRLYILALVALISLQLYLLGRNAGKTHVIGLMAIGLVFLTGELDLTPQKTDLWPMHEGYNTFLNLFYPFLRSAPSLIMGCALFLGTITAVGDFVILPERGRWRRSILQAAFIGFMALAVINAKLFPAAVLIGGLVLFAIWGLFTSRRIEARAMAIVAITGALLAWRFVTYFRFNEGAPLAIQPLMMAQFMPVLAGWADVIKTLPALAQWPALVILNLVGFTGQMPFHVLGSALLLVMTRGRPSRLLALLLGFFIAGTGFLWIFWFNGAYALLHTAYLCGAITGAAGFWMLLKAISTWPGWKKALVYGPISVLLVISLMDIPLDNISKWRNLLAGKATYPTERNLLTPNLYAGMLWLRNNSSPNDVIAVNNQFRQGSSDPRYIYFSAFAERRVFLEGWVYEHEPWWDERMAGFPYRDQLALNRQIFLDADTDSARELFNRGVKFLVVDKLHGKWNPDIKSFSAKVFGNSDVEIYALNIK